MKRSKRIKAIHELAAREENLMARRVSERLFNLQAEESRLEQLTDYLNEYRLLAAEQTDTADIAIIRSRRQFVERLQVCVRHQQELVERLCDQLEQQVDDWNETRTKALAIERYGDRAADRERTADARREQAELDHIGLLPFATKH